MDGTEDCSGLRSKVDRKLSDYKAARSACARERQELEGLSLRLSALKEAHGLAQQVAQSVQTQAHQQIAKIVTKCLEAVFDEDVAFRIDFQRKRGKTEARLLFEIDGEEVDPITAEGGGLIDVAAFGLRLCAIGLSKPRLRPCLVLDEPFRFVSVDLRGRVRTLVETLAKEMKVQIVMVTHDTQLRTGKVIDLG